jgi:hypothetical protein
MLTDITEVSATTPICGPPRDPSPPNWPSPVVASLPIRGPSPPPPQRISLRERPTKKPKRLNIKAPKKAPAKKPFKKGPQKLKIPTKEPNKELLVRKYVASIQNLRPEPIMDDFDVAFQQRQIDLDATSKSGDNDSFMTPDSGEGPCVMECEP